MPGDNLFSGPGAPSRACHNCRQRRLRCVAVAGIYGALADGSISGSVFVVTRCDRSVPACRKCSSTGEACRGYGVVLRWANGPALRGKLAATKGEAGDELKTPSAGIMRKVYGPNMAILPSPSDPLLAHLSRDSRSYVHHFSTAVCQDLVSFDQPDRNPFRHILPLAAGFDFLEAILVAKGAMHLAALRACDSELGGPELVDALVAKGRAIRRLRAAVEAVMPATEPVVLAATVFLVNLELIDSGRGAWQPHMAAAGALMPSLLSPQFATLDSSLAACVNAIAADFLTYRVLGAAINGVSLNSSWSTASSQAEFLCVLRRAEAHAYHCCPPEILQVMLEASSLCESSAPRNRIEHAETLLLRACAFDVVHWVRNIRGLSDRDDLGVRVSVASAHRAAACLYLLLAVPETAEGTSFPSLTVDGLVREVLEHLEAVPVGHVHLKGTIWPTFVAGAQADDPAQRAWCAGRMRALGSSNPWACPWGYIRTAARVMEQLWEARDKAAAAGGTKSNWLMEVKRMRGKYLIV
ncbi:hypothetical protein VTJ83DRAFT_1432 [Remersonia thermophila]|uniref:Zn(2)-C6 fungal-type domain-containing protein n=1 Tax=Remersonia thermophila TaxID=72144 RepID=A0ABR4DQ51_9PEZI